MGRNDGLSADVKKEHQPLKPKPFSASQLLTAIHAVLSHTPIRH
jgi:hypothetical protein